MFRIVTDSEFPALWVVVMDDPERGEVKVSGPVTDVGHHIFVTVPRLEAKFAQVTSE